MIKSPQFYLMGLLFILVSGCAPVQPKICKNTSSTTSTMPPSPTNRQCFSKASTPKQRTQKTVFMLATGADTGDLKKTSYDVENFSQAMQRHFKIPQSQICQLPNAFKAEMEAALQSLNKHLTENDLVIIYFSGHGSFITDNENADEKDGWDEILVTYDSQCTETPTDDDGLRDDDFVQLVNRLPTDRVLTVIDSCFASGMLLGASFPNPLLANAHPKFLVRGELGTQAPRPQPDAKYLIKNEVGKLDSLKGLLLAAAKEDQYAYEMPEKGGRFTFEFVEQLSQYADIKTAFDQTAKKIDKTTQNSPFPQTPQMTESWEILKENSN